MSINFGFICKKLESQISTNFVNSVYKAHFDSKLSKYDINGLPLLPKIRSIRLHDEMKQRAVNKKNINRDEVRNH